DLRELGAQSLDDLFGRQLALFPRLEADEHEPLVAAAAAAARTGVGEERLDVWIGLDHLRDGLLMLHQRLERDAFARLGDTEDAAHFLAGHESLGHDGEER